MRRSGLRAQVGELHPTAAASPRHRQIARRAGRDPMAAAANRPELSGPIYRRRRAAGPLAPVTTPMRVRGRPPSGG